MYLGASPSLRGVMHTAESVRVHCTVNIPVQEMKVKIVVYFSLITAQKLQLQVFLYKAKFPKVSNIKGGFSQLYIHCWKIF